MTSWYFVARATYPSNTEAMLWEEAETHGGITMNKIREIVRHFKEDEKFVVKGEHPRDVIVTFFHRIEEDTER